MVAEKISCQRCGDPFISLQNQRKIFKIAEEKGLDKCQVYFTLCQNCRAQVFAEQMIENNLERAERVKHVAKRRRERFYTIKVDTRLGTTVYKSECYICNQGCDALVHVKDGKVVLIEGDPSSTVTKGTLCCKGLASKEMLYHPDRLLYPMKRVGKRGEGKWERITWNEALDTIAMKFNEIEQKYDKDGIVLATGTNRGWIRYFLRFANAYGKQWIGPGIAQCFYPRMTG